MNNYRGMTLTSIFSKIFSILLEVRLRKWANDNEVLTDFQFGFRNKRGTIDCVFISNRSLRSLWLVATIDAMHQEGRSSRDLGAMCKDGRSSRDIGAMCKFVVLPFRIEAFDHPCS